MYVSAIAWLYSVSRIYKKGLMDRAIILCKLNKSLLESSTSVGIHRQNRQNRQKPFVFNKPVGTNNVKKLFVYYVISRFC